MPHHGFHGRQLGREVSDLVCDQWGNLALAFDSSRTTIMLAFITTSF